MPRESAQPKSAMVGPRRPEKPNVGSLDGGWPILADFPARERAGLRRFERKQEKSHSGTRFPPLALASHLLYIPDMATKVRAKSAKLLGSSLGRRRQNPKTDSQPDVVIRTKNGEFMIQMKAGGDVRIKTARRQPALSAALTKAFYRGKLAALGDR